MIYKYPKYIFPPRPERCFPRSGMKTFDDGTYLAEPKYNGKCTEVYFGENWNVYNRHKDLTEFKITKNEIQSIIPNSGQHLIVGEYMNTSKKDENNKIFNNKFMIFDIIVFNNDHLIGKTFQERMELLIKLVCNKIIRSNDYSYQLSDNVFLTKTFYKDFGDLWDHFVQVDMLEGLVLKKINSPLEPGVVEMNNHRSMIKCRKKTKNYKH